MVIKMTHPNRKQSIELENGEVHINHFHPNYKDFEIYYKGIKINSDKASFIIDSRLFLGVIEGITNEIDRLNQELVTESETPKLSIGIKHNWMKEQCPIEKEPTEKLSIINSWLKKFVGER